MKLMKLMKFTLYYDFSHFIDIFTATVTVRENIFCHYVWIYLAQERKEIHYVNHPNNMLFNSIYQIITGSLIDYLF